MQRESQARKTALGICDDEAIRSLHLSMFCVFFFFLPLLPVLCADSAATDTALSGASDSNSSCSYTVVTETNNGTLPTLTQLA